MTAIVGGRSHGKYIATMMQAAERGGNVILHGSHPFWDKVEDFYRSVKIEQERRLEFALRYLIPYPIKGDITKNKLKWRGIYLMLLPQETPRLEEGEETAIVHCSWRFPILCIRQSKSGKRKEVRINLNFNDEVMALYHQEKLREQIIASGSIPRDRMELLTNKQQTL